MKISTMPYGEIDINGKAWWTACNVYNPSSYPVSCTIKLFDKTGKLRGEESRILAAKESYMISPGWIRSKLSVDATRHTIEVYGDVLVSSYIADDSRAIFTDNPIFVTDSDDTELRYKYNFFKEYWNNKQPKEIIHYITRSLLVGRNEQQRCPVQLYVTPNDPVIVEDIVKNNLMVKDIWNCDRDIVEIYRHTRFKTINPFNYVTDIANVKKDEYWMFPWELRQYKAGDCDDWSAELASYLIAAGIPNWRVRIVVGDTFNGGGHSTVYVLRDDLRTWRHVDSTMMIGGNVTSLDHTMFNTNTGMSIKTVWCSFNNEFAWRRFDGQTVAESEFSYLKVGMQS